MKGGFVCQKQKIMGEGVGPKVMGDGVHQNVIGEGSLTKSEGGGLFAKK